MAENQGTASGSEYRLVSPLTLRRNPQNPRGEVTEADVRDLMASIEMHGILQPLVIHPDGEIIAGERRWVSALVLDLDLVPVVVRESVDSDESADLALAENVQREQLKPSVEAKIYAQKRAAGLSVSEIAEQSGFLSGRIYQLLAILELSPETQKAVDDGVLSMRSAQELAKVKDVRQRESVASVAIANNFTTEQVRNAIRLQDGNQPLDGLSSVSKKSRALKSYREPVSDLTLGQKTAGEVQIQYVNQLVMIIQNDLLDFSQDRLSYALHKLAELIQTKVPLHPPQVRASGGKAI